MAITFPDAPTEGDTVGQFRYDGSKWVWADTLYGAPATISDTPTGSFTDGGVTYNYWRFTASGTLTVTQPGLADILVLGGGSGGAATPYVDAAGGGGGGLTHGIYEVSAGTYTITIGAGGAGSYGNGVEASDGNDSSFGTLVKGGGAFRAVALNGLGLSYTFKGGGINVGGFSNDSNSSVQGAGAGGELWATNRYDGKTLNYTGTSVAYGPGGRAPSTTSPSANTGGGGYGQSGTGAGNGASGVVIVKVRA